MKMYALIDNGKATMMELCEYYTLDEALKLYALMSMHQDIEAMRLKEMERGRK